MIQSGRNEAANTLSSSDWQERNKSKCGDEAQAESERPGEHDCAKRQELGAEDAETVRRSPARGTPGPAR